MSDAIFWYTGAAIWACIAVAFAAGLILAWLLGVLRFYRKGANWQAVRFFAKHGIDRKEILTLVRRAHHKLPKGCTAVEVSDYLAELYRVAQQKSTIDDGWF